MPITYRDAGVDIAAGNSLIERIKPLAAATRRPEVLADIGGFAGLCRLMPGLRDPVLVAGADGVGTKLKVAFETGTHDTIGIDLVAMCANDVATTGAEPLFFLDYFGCGKLDLDVAERVIGGIAQGCKQAGCALLGGETAELPGLYADGEYDLAGFCVGVVEREAILDGRRIAVGDRLVGIASSGLHSNGYSLARKVLPRDAETLAELLVPTRIYVRAIRALRAACDVRGLAHVTGGGLIENPPRMLPRGSALTVAIDYAAFAPPPIFARIQRAAGVDDAEMRKTFNLGIGLVACVPAAEVDTAIRAVAEAGERAFAIGRIQG